MLSGKGKSSLRVAAAVVALWGATVAIVSLSRGFTGLSPYVLLSLITGGILLPAAAYFLSPALQEGMRAIGLRAITAFHGWRILAAFLFWYYGAKGLLPANFVARAAWGDLLAGVIALLVAALWPRRSGYWLAHTIGMADFVLAVGTGLTMTLANAAQMQAVTLFPLALIPLFGVGVTGATHIVAFHLLLRSGTGVPVGRSAMA